MTTIFTDALSSSDNASSSYTFRNILPITGGALDQVRVTFKASSNVGTNGPFNVAHASIGILNGAYPGTKGGTTAVPVELKFGGVSGFDLTTNSQTIVSDWTNLTGFTSSNYLVVIIDLNNVTWGCAADLSPTGVTMWYESSSTSYNIQLPSGAGSTTAQVEGISLIEVQSTAPPGIVSIFFSNMSGTNFNIT